MSGAMKLEESPAFRRMDGMAYRDAGGAQFRAPELPKEPVRLDCEDETTQVLLCWLLQEATDCRWRVCRENWQWAVETETIGWFFGKTLAEAFAGAFAEVAS